MALPLAMGNRPGASRRPTAAWLWLTVGLLAALVFAASWWLASARSDAAASATEAAWPDASRPQDDDALRSGLAQHLQRQPGDARALIFQARLDLQAQRFAQAVAGYERALQGRSKAALDAGVWVEYAEAVALAQGGRLAGQPTTLLAKALALNGQHPQALDLAGTAAWEAGDYRQAAAYWQQLLTQLPETSPRHAALRTAIERAGQRARLALPPAR